MTREEATAYWKQRSEHIHKWLEENEDVDCIGEYVEAIDMAIEALSADTVSREFYEDAVKANIRIVMENREVKEEYINTVGAILAVISAPSCLKEVNDLIEPLRVVRCKDCRHHGMRDCPVWGDDTTEDYMWCYYGERKEP